MSTTHRPHLTPDEHAALVPLAHAAAERAHAQVEASTDPATKQAFTLTEAFYAHLETRLLANSTPPPAPVKRGSKTTAPAQLYQHIDAIKAAQTVPQLDAAHEAAMREHGGKHATTIGEATGKRRAEIGK